MTIENAGGSGRSNSCERFYPKQSCSNVCGVVVICMVGVLCDKWDLWLTWNNQTLVPLLSNPTMNSRQLRLIAMSWIVNNSLSTHYFVSSKSTDADVEMMETDKNVDYVSGGKVKPRPVCDTDTKQSQFTAEDRKEDNNHNPQCLVESDDDFMESKKPKKKILHTESKQSDTEDELHKNDKVARPLIFGMLPDNYTYKMLTVAHFDNLDSFSCHFRIKIDNEDNTRKWITQYNEKTKETMVFECCKSLSGKRVLKKLFLRCQHKQRQTGQHTKINRPLKTTHKSHNNKHTNCPAQMKVTLLPPRKQNGFCVDVTLSHTHNHSIDVADALRFRPMSESTKQKYYDLFKQGHSPASAHMEYETQLSYIEEPNILADRSRNPKVSDVYNLFNKWRKSNLGVRSGKQLFTELERRVNIYNDAYGGVGGKAIIQRYCKGKNGGSNDGEGVDQPLILAICTPLMSRVHEYTLQSKELVYIDASSSFDDFNNPLFVMSTSSAAGGLPLGIVITSVESADVIHKGMTALKGLFPNTAFYGKDYPENIIIDDSLAERDGLRQTWPSSNIFLCTFHFLQSMWRWLLCSKNCIHKDERQYLMNLVRKLVLCK